LIQLAIISDGELLPGLRAFDVEDRPKIKSRPRIVIMLKKLYGHGSAKKKRFVAKGLLRSRKDPIL
jgi:hypothetical protein